MSLFFSILDIVSQLNRKQCYDAQLLNKLSYVKRCYVLCVIGNEAEIGNFFSGLVEVDGNHTINTQPRIHTHTHTNTKYFIVHNYSCTSSALCDWNACESIFFYWRWKKNTIYTFPRFNRNVHLSGNFILIRFGYNRNIVEMAQKKNDKHTNTNCDDEWQ